MAVSHLIIVRVSIINQLWKALEVLYHIPKEGLSLIRTYALIGVNTVGDEWFVTNKLLQLVSIFQPLLLDLL